MGGMALNPLSLVTISFVGGPCHGKWLTKTMGSLRASVGERYRVFDGEPGNDTVTIHEYRFAHIQGPMIVAKYGGLESHPTPADLNRRSP